MCVGLGVREEATTRLVVADLAATSDLVAAYGSAVVCGAARLVHVCETAGVDPLDVDGERCVDLYENVGGQSRATAYRDLAAFRRVTGWL